MEKKLYTVTVFTENNVGLLNQISIIFTRRCLNIESLSVSPSSIRGVHKFSITCYSDREMMERVVKQIEKRIDVLRSFLYTDDDLIYQEVALYKVPTAKVLDIDNVESIIRTHGARILEITPDYIVFEKTGHSYETEALFNELRKYDICQFVRSGRAAITRATEEFVTMYLKEQYKRKTRYINENNTTNQQQ